MTKNEAIEIICDKTETCEFYFAEHDHYPEWCDYEFLQALGKAIFALKEVQRYQEIGTVEECKELASMVTTEKKNVLGQIVDEWKEYIEIGTLEECRKAVEKQKVKYIKIESYCPAYCPAREDNFGEIVTLEDFDRHPTAFDKEKVIEELEDYLFEKYCVEGDEKIAEIVEKGGIE